MKNKRDRCLVIGTLSVALAVSCYHLESQSTVLTGAPAWTGAGHASAASSYFGGRAIGLAGEDIHFFKDASHTTYDSPLLSHLGAGHTLTGIAQTHVLGHHENTFLHGYPAGDVGALDLFLTTGFHFNSATRVEASFPWFIDGSDIYEVTRICDIAGTGIPAYGHPADDDSHLFLSVWACELGDASSCVGGVVEADFGSSLDEWWVRSAGGWQAAIHRPGGSFFSRECMPISVTGLGDTNTHYLVVGDPSMDEVSVFRVGELDEAPVSSRRTSRTQAIRDLVVEGQGSGATDFSFVTVLWGGSAGTTLEHTLATNGALGSAPFLVEPVATSTSYIHTTGAGGKPSSDKADLFTFGTSVVRRTYDKD